MKIVTTCKAILTTSLKLSGVTFARDEQAYSQGGVRHIEWDIDTDIDTCKLGGSVG